MSKLKAIWLICKGYPVVYKVNIEANTSYIEGILFVDSTLKHTEGSNSMIGVAK